MYACTLVQYRKCYEKAKQCRYTLTMTTGVKALPNEIQDRILDFLHDSKPTLKACSLVCKTWVPTSRYHLFSTGRIRLHGRDARSCETLLKNPNCTIQSCMHFSASLDDPETAVNVSNVLQCLSPSSLHIQQFSNLYWHTLRNFHPSPTIERLEVGSGCIFVVTELFVAFPNVRDLWMNCPPMDPPQLNTDILIRPPQLRSLEFSKCDMNPLLRLFMKKRIVPTNLFCINDIAIDEVPIVGEYFSMFGNVLQDIRLRFYPDDDPDILGMYEQLHSAFCVNAHSVSIREIL